MKRFIRIDEEGKIYSIRYGKNKVADEIESNEGEMGYIMQEDGTFVAPEIEQETPAPTFEEKVTNALESINVRLAKIEGVAEDRAEA